MKPNWASVLHGIDAQFCVYILAEMIHLIDDGVISGKIAKKLLPQIVETGQSSIEIVKRYDLTRITSREEIKELVEEVFSKNEKAVHDALKDDNAINYLVGQLMKLSSGRVDPLIANKVIREGLKEVVFSAANSILTS